MKKKNIQFVKIKNEYRQLVNDINNNKFGEKFYTNTATYPNYTYQWLDIFIPSKKNNKITYWMEILTPNVKLMDLAYKNAFDNMSDNAYNYLMSKESNDFIKNYDSIINNQLQIFEKEYGTCDKYSVYESVNCFKMYKYGFEYGLAVVIDTKFLTIPIINNWIDNFYNLNEPIEYRNHIIDKNNLIFKSNWESTLEVDLNLINFTTVNKIKLVN